jgi:hypothetical protein
VPELIELLEAEVAAENQRIPNAGKVPNRVSVPSTSQRSDLAVVGMHESKGPVYYKYLFLLHYV